MAYFRRQSTKIPWSIWSRNVSNQSGYEKFNIFRSGIRFNNGTGKRKFSSKSREGRWIEPTGVVGAVTFVGGTFYLCFRVRSWLEEPHRAPLAVVMEEEIEPISRKPHPFSSAPWYWRWYFTSRRFCYLLYIFVPVFAISVVSSYFPKAKSLRQKFLDSLTDALEKAGCCFLKFGQWVSMRPDMFAADIVKALSRLRDAAPVHDFLHTRQVIKEAFGKEIEEIFEYFEEKPVASGSVAQVHKARLRPEYAEHGIVDVAVKVRHPRVFEESYVDVDFVFGIATSLKNEHSNTLVLPFSKEDFAALLRQQMDLSVEAKNLVRFAANFASEVKEGAINFPAVATSLISQKVLVESWVEGKSIASIFVTDQCQSLVEAGKNKLKEVSDQTKRALARLVFDVQIKMFLRDNYIHGDMHAGNILFDPEKGITIIDAGLITSLAPDASKPFGEFLRAVCVHDLDTICDKLIEFNCATKAVNRRALMDDLQRATEGYVGSMPGRSPAGGCVRVGDLVGSILLELNKHNIILRGDVAGSLVCISVSEGTILQLDPKFDIITSALPYFIKYKRVSQIL